MQPKQGTLLSQGFSEVLNVQSIHRVHPRGEILCLRRAPVNKEDAIVNQSRGKKKGFIIFSVKPGRERLDRNGKLKNEELEQAGVSQSASVVRGLGKESEVKKGRTGRERCRQAEEINS